MIRKPTIFVLFIVLGFLGVYFYSRHDLVKECPTFFKEPMRAYASPAGMEYSDDMHTWTGCTIADPVYLDMEQWAFYARVSGVLCGMLFLADIASFTLRRTSLQDDIMIKRGKITVQRRRLLHKISRFLGGL
ncbi:MAG: hypothetical protein ABI142_06925 [Bryocella sp.]